MGTKKMVEIIRNLPPVAYDVDVRRHNPKNPIDDEDVVWWSRDAVYLNVYFDELPEDVLKTSGIEPVIKRSGSGFYLAAKEHEKVAAKRHGKSKERDEGQWTELKYTIEARYPDGSYICFDPKVKIQP